MSGLKLVVLTVITAAFAYYAFVDTVDYASLLSGKRVIVCGASTGIGEELAYTYARYGANIVITARREAVLEKVAEKCKQLGASSVAYIALDLAEPSSAEELIELAQESMGGIDVVVLNHIIGYYGPWSSKSVDSLKKAGRILEVNALSYFAIATHALKALEESGGSIVVVSSFAGKAGAPFTAPYSASKHALHGFFDSLRLDLAFAKSNISITLCVLGYINTESAINRTSGVILLPPVPANLTAAAIAMGGARREREIYYPRSLALAIYVKPFFPHLLELLMQFTHDPSQFNSNN